jgi:tetratricopeptide (TPR) repeat protein
MASTTTQLASLLLHLRLVSETQLDAARTLQNETGCRLEDALLKLGFVTPREMACLHAELYGLTSIELATIVIPPEVIEMVPESVARENVVLPLAAMKGTIWMAVSDPDVDTFQKLAFILNKQIRPIVAPRDQIVEAINRHYGEIETESVDSVLAEFTDTQIDFTQTELQEADFDLPLDDDEFACEDSTAALSRCRSEPAPLQRQATIRYFERMNPQRMFPLLVVLSKAKIEAVIQKGVAQARSERFQVDAGALVEVEPILPGCACYPPRDQVSVAAPTATATFWVVPHVLGKVMQARVAVRQHGRLLAEVPLEVKVVRQSLTLLLSALSLALPLLLMILRHFRLDFESQLADGFGLYAKLGNWAVSALSPELLTVLLLLAAAVAYLCLRPRRREVFWDVTPTKEEQDETVVTPPRPTQLASEPLSAALAERQADLFASAEESYRQADHARALALYESGLALGLALPLTYHHAALAAHHTGQTRRALSILQEAEARLHPAEIPATLWYNLACFSTRLGRLAAAMHYLSTAIDRGYHNADKIQHDPDLEPLRWRSDFKSLLADLRNQSVAGQR